MWLIHNSTLQLEQSPEDYRAHGKHRYAILSHRWQDEEVTFAEMSSDMCSKRKGYRKIQRCCEMAKAAGLDYSWVDTCCIDKTNSVELSEAINSMFRWYSEAAVCYVWLEDIHAATMADFAKAEWFERGWTLQELLAPQRVEFFDRDWAYVGTKDSLDGEISERTGISVETLKNPSLIQQQPIASRMAWAADRKTSRVEDRAYSLLGIFNINMPMLYGEGERAFTRLQEEIIKYSDDETIFAWQDTDIAYCGLLAPNPDAFAMYGDMKPLIFRDEERQPYALTNKGIALQVHNMWRYAVDTWVTTIFCWQNGEAQDFWGIFLRKLERNNHFARVQVQGKSLANNILVRSLLDSEKSIFKTPQTIDIRQAFNLHLEQDDLLERLNGFRIGRSLLQTTAEGIPIYRFDGNTWDPTIRTWTAEVGRDWEKAKLCLDISAYGTRIKKIILGFDHDFNPWCKLFENGDKVRDYDKDYRHTRIWHNLPPHGGVNKSGFVQRWDNFESWLGHEHDVRNVLLSLESRTSSQDWSLMGDRIEGLDLYLPRYPLESIRYVNLESKDEFRDGVYFSSHWGLQEDAELRQWEDSCGTNSSPCHITLKKCRMNGPNGDCIGWDFNIENLYYGVLPLFETIPAHALWLRGIDRKYEECAFHFSVDDMSRAYELNPQLRRDEDDLNPIPNA